MNGFTTAAFASQFRRFPRTIKRRFKTRFALKNDSRAGHFQGSVERTSHVCTWRARVLTFRVLDRPPTQTRIFASFLSGCSACISRACPCRSQQCTQWLLIVSIEELQIKQKQARGHRNTKVRTMNRKASKGATIINQCLMPRRVSLCFLRCTAVAGF